LRHVRYRDQGYYGGRQDEDLDHSGVLGIDGVATKGFVTRGVLVDIPRYMAAHDRPWAPLVKARVGVDLLEAILDWQSAPIRAGDVLLVRTGWLESWMARPVEQRVEDRPETPGLHPGHEMAGWLWNRGVVAVAADNVAVEPVPFTEKGDGQLHFRLLPLLGIMMGELFKLEELAADCDADGVYEGLFVSAPLKLPRGVCSPPNAYLIK
jgi:kynurenine formamidase